MQLKKWQNASTEDRKRKKNSFFTKQKLGAVRTYSHRNREFFQIEKAPNGGPYQDT